MQSRRGFIKLGIGATAVAAGGVALAGCGTSESVEGKSSSKFKGILGCQEFDNASTPNKQAFQTLAAVGGLLGVDTREFVYDANPDLQLSQIAQMDTIGVTAFETLMLDNGITRQVALASQSAGVYCSARAQIGNWVFPSEPSINWHYQGFGTPGQGAYSLCKAMFKEMGGTGEFAYIDGPPESTTVRAKGISVERALKEFPGIKLVSRQDGGANREKSQSVMDSILVAHPNVKAVYCVNDDSALGALTTLRERKKTGQVIVSGADGIPEALQAIEDGEMFATEAFSVPWLTAFCMVRALDVASGFKPTPLEGLMIADLLSIDTPAAAAAYRRIVTQDVGGVDVKKLSRQISKDNWDPQWPMIALDPEQYWTVDRGVPKPDGFKVPSDYEADNNDAGRARINALYAKQLKSFPYSEVVAKGRTGKTVLQAAGLR